MLLGTKQRTNESSKDLSPTGPGISKRLRCFNKGSMRESTLVFKVLVSRVGDDKYRRLIWAYIIRSINFNKDTNNLTLGARQWRFSF